MVLARLSAVARMVPKKRQRHHSFDEGVDESPQLIEQEAVEIETEKVSEENEPVERNDDADKTIPPAFEEE